MKTRFACILCVGTAALAPPAVVSAQTEAYPVKAVRIIAPFPPGGSVDTVARIIATRLADSYGQQFVVDNRGGASGSIGMEIAANAPGDGYTLVVNTLPLITNQFLYKKVPYDPLRDFVAISLLTGTGAVLCVHPSVPAKSVRELLQVAKTRGDTLNYGTAGAGTNPHIAGELFNYLGKVNITAVHFKGGGPATIANLSGEISMGFSTVPTTLGYLRAGRLRALGVTTDKRVPQLPDVPAIAETLPGYEFSTWQGILAPKNTPRVIVDSLAARIKKTLAAADTIRRMNDGGFDVIASTPDEFTAYLKLEADKWGKVLRDRGFKPQ